jgi:hypothetical protein
VVIDALNEGVYRAVPARVCYKTARQVRWDVAVEALEEGPDPFEALNALTLGTFEDGYMGVGSTLGVWWTSGR